MTTKHTPGPWIANNASVHTEQGLLIASVMRNSANARLIAAAPEVTEALAGLLEALRDYKRYGSEDDAAEIEHAIDRATNALAKARS